MVDTLERRLMHAFTESWGDVVDRSEPFFDDISQAYQRHQYASRRRDRLDGRFIPVYDNEVDLAIIRAMGRLMHERVPMAKAKTRRLQDYTISRGFDWSVTHDSPELQSKINSVLKSFMRDNKWSVIGERDSFEAECVDGEWLADLAYVDGQIAMNWLTADNLVEPLDPRALEEWKHIDYPCSWLFGVATRENAPQLPKWYHVVRDEGGTDWDLIPEKRFLHWKRNSPIMAKRGYSDHYTTHVYLGRSDKVLANTAEGAAIQAAIAYIVEHIPGTTSKQAQNVVSGLMNVNRRDPVTGLVRRSKKIVPGQRVDIPAGMKYHAGLFGKSNNDIYVKVMESLIRLAGTVEAFPEHMLTGFAGNNNMACHDEKTEVLTADGWKSFTAIDEKTHLGTYNKNTGQLEYQRPYAIQRGLYSGKMLHFSGRDYDMMVTPNHRMLVSDHATVREVVGGRRRSRRLSKLRPWEFHRADSLPRKLNAIPFAVKPIRSYSVPKKFILPKLSRKECHANGSNSGSRRDRQMDLKPWVQFLGWYLSEGWATVQEGKAYTVSLSQNAGPEADLIRKVLSELPFRCREFVARERGSATNYGVASEDNINWSIADKGLVRWLEANAGTSSENKRIPGFVWALPAGAKEWLLESLILGDGRHLPNGSQLFFSVSDQLIDDVQRLAFECGWFVQETKKIKRTRVLSLRNATKRIAGVRRRRVMKVDTEKVSEVAYEGWIYCASVPNETLVTRRNGKIGISGNSSLTAESPFIQGRLSDQEVRKMRLIEMIEKVVRIAYDCGMFRGWGWDEVYGGLEITVQEPSIVSRDPVALTQSLSLQKAEGWLSDRTASQEIGRDYEQEQQNIEEEGGGQGADTVTPGQGGMSALSRLQFKRNSAAINDILSDLRGGSSTEQHARTMLKALGLSDDEVNGLLASPDPSAVPAVEGLRLSARQRAILESWEQYP